MGDICTSNLLFSSVLVADMKLLTQVLKHVPEFQQLLAAIDNGQCPAAVSGLSAVHRAHFAAAIRGLTQRPVVMICADESESERMAKDLAFLTGEQELVRPDEEDMSAKRFDWIQEIASQHGLCKDREEAAALLRNEVAKVCAQVLADAGVYKLDDNGLNGFKRFMASLGYEA